MSVQPNNPTSPTVVRPLPSSSSWTANRAPQTVEELEQVCDTPEGRKSYLMQHNQLFYAWAMGGITAAPGRGSEFKGKKYHYLFQAMSEIPLVELVGNATVLGQAGINLSAVGNKIMGTTRYLSRPSVPVTVTETEAQPVADKPWYRRFFGGRRTKRRLTKRRKTRKSGKK